MPNTLSEVKDVWDRIAQVDQPPAAGGPTQPIPDGWGGEIDGWTDDAILLHFRDKPRGRGHPRYWLPISHLRRRGDELLATSWILRKVGLAPGGR